MSPQRMIIFESFALQNRVTLNFDLLANINTHLVDEENQRRKSYILCK